MNDLKKSWKISSFSRTIVKDYNLGKGLPLFLLNKIDQFKKNIINS